MKNFLKNAVKYLDNFEDEHGFPSYEDDEKSKGKFPTSAKDFKTEEQSKKLGEKIGIIWDEEEWEPKDLLAGIKVELEHGTVDSKTNITNDDPEMTAKIAWAHLNEDPKYYDKLAKMEKTFPGKEYDQEDD
jgi:hypothetical protein